MVSHETHLSCPTCRHMKAAKYFNSTLPCPKHLNNSRCCWCGKKPPDVEVKPKYDFDASKFLFVCLFVMQPCQQHQLHTGIPQFLWFQFPQFSILFPSPLVLQWNLDLRKILGVTKSFLKSRFFFISNTRKPLKKHNFAK